MAGPLYPSDDSQGSRTSIRDGLSDRAYAPEDGGHHRVAAQPVVPESGPTWPPLPGR
jgi:hypothetical protein